MTDLIPRPTDDYDVAGWQAYYAANPHELRAVGADAAPDDGGDGGEGGEGGGDGGTRTGESLIDLDAGGDDPDAGKGGEGEGNGAETAEVEVGDSKVSVPKAVADELTELRTKAAEAGESRAPEGDYELVVPEDLAKDGIAILMISSELPEIIGVADRVLVMRDGSIVGEVSAREDRRFTQEEIMELATGASGT